MKFILSGLFVSVLASISWAFPPNASHGSKPNPTSTSKEIVFIHGMFMTPVSWQPWLDYFGKDYQVSAPAWPYHEDSTYNLKTKANPGLGGLTLEMILDHYRKLLAPKKANPPILIGHSMGGLIAQVLLSEGLGSAAIAIDSAPPQWIFPLSFSFLKANLPAFNFFVDKNEPIRLSKEDFAYAFANTQTPEVQNEIYEKFYVPESRRVSRGPLTKAAAVKTTNSRGPLLLIAGEEDHIIPAQLNFLNYEYYRVNTENENYTEFLLFKGRDHWTIGGPGWESVADAIKAWLKN